MSYRLLGIIKGPVGVRGNLVISGISGDIGKIQPDTIAKIGFSLAFSTEYKILSVKQFTKSIEVSLSGINSPEAVARLKENAVFIDEKNFVMEDDELFVSDLIGDKSIQGFSVIERQTGKVIGIVTDVWLLPANDVWVVKTENGNLPLPVIDDVVKKVDKKNRTIAIDMLPGLEDLIEKEEEPDGK